MAQRRFRTRQPHRLPSDAYEDHGTVWHITIGAADRSSRPFANAELASRICDWLEAQSSADGTRILVYCLMPDHLHIVYQVEDGNAISVIGKMKSLTTRMWWEAGGTGRLWQPSFHDHGIRESEDIEGIFTYILNNPVRAGLAATWEDYPYMGGTLVAVE
ncbi:MAG: transposase [Thermomicrobiales bacterium]|nr:transposase [Thermomicrobiales bacterium]